MGDCLALQCWSRCPHLLLNISCKPAREKAQTRSGDPLQQKTESRKMLTRQKRPLNLHYPFAYNRVWENPVKYLYILSSVSLTIALIALCSCSGEIKAKSSGGGGKEFICISASSCPKNCSTDDDCKTDEGQVCCNFGEFGKACIMANNCPYFCGDDGACEIEEGERCCRTAAYAPEKVCAQATECLITCSSNLDCTGYYDDYYGDELVCCLIMKDPICTSSYSCPRECNDRNDCDEGELCCEDFNDSYGIYKSGVSGICNNSCRQKCNVSSDCDGQVCCRDGYCNDTCPKYCRKDEDCDMHEGEVCCDNQAMESPWWWLWW